jgi:hypothetical protein
MRKVFGSGVMIVNMIFRIGRVENQIIQEMEFLADLMVKIM